MISGVRRSGARACTALPSASLRTPTKTWKPLSASSSAVAAPIPVEVPVTTTKPRSLDAALIVSSRESCRCLLETGLQLLRGSLVDLRNRRADGVLERAGDRIGVVVVVDRDDPRRAGWQGIVHLFADPCLYALAGDLAEDATCSRSDRCGCE